MPRISGTLFPRLMGDPYHTQISAAEWGTNRLILELYLVVLSTPLASALCTHPDVCCLPGSCVWCDGRHCWKVLWDNAIVLSSLRRPVVVPRSSFLTPMGKVLIQSGGSEALHTFSVWKTPVHESSQSFSSRVYFLDQEDPDLLHVIRSSSLQAGFFIRS